MLPRTCPMLRRSAAAVLIAAGLAAAPAPARAQDGKIGVIASPRIIASGQSANVDVLAYVPVGAYAFASSQFDIHATHPRWTFASSGAIGAADVLGISVGQQHLPQTGLFADPANPYRAWRGAITPVAAGPALVEITADPSAFSIYPSKLTPSWSSVHVEGGSDLIFVNPLAAGRWIAAPGPGTAARVHDDVIVDGRIITGENPSAAILIGLLLPAVQKIPESEVRVAFDGVVETFTTTVQVEEAQRSRVTSLSLTFDSPDAAPGSGHPGGVNVCLSDGSVRFVRYTAFQGGVFVAAGDLDQGDPGLVPSLTVESTPDVISTRVGRGMFVLSAGYMYRRAEWTLRYDQPVTAIVRDAEGKPRSVVIDSIAVQASLDEPVAPARSGHNLKQLSLGAHTYEATGVRSMAVTPRQPR